MCGIIGFSGAWGLSALRKGISALAHRGPDDSGEYLQAGHGVGLGHTRLSILDLSDHGHQPMLRAKGDVVLVFNGEIYNFPELREQLEASGVTFDGHSDTEVLINLYLAHGEAMLSLLNGIFAFAIWDQRTQILLVARDALGVKPLYYTENRDGFAFASEVKALRPMLPSTCELDPQSLHRYLTYLWCPGEGTPLREVKKLLPGHALCVREGKVMRRWSWYRLPMFETDRSFCDEREGIAGVAHHLKRAVQRQMLADVPLGAFLSGGLDSSAIVAFAARQNPEIRCYTIEAIGGGDAGEEADLPYARKVAAHLKVPLEIVRIDSGVMASDLEQMVRQLDEPLADPAALNVYYISQLARSQGVKVLLSGAGGDDLFSGYRRHLAVSMKNYWSWMPANWRSNLGSLGSHLDQRRPLQRRIAKLLDGLALNGDEALANYFVWSSEASLYSLYTKEFLARLNGAKAAAPMLEFLGGLPADTSSIERTLALEQRFFLADHNLLYTDKMSMAAGVEVRVPFLDADLVRFAATIPATVKQRGRTGKWVLKKAMEPFLPHDVIYRKKTGFGAPLRRWMRGELKALVADVLSAESLRRRGVFDPAAVRNLIAANDSGRVDASYTLLSLLCIELWCREYMGAR